MLGVSERNQTDIFYLVMILVILSKSMSLFKNAEQAFYLNGGTTFKMFSRNWLQLLTLDSTSLQLRRYYTSFWRRRLASRKKLTAGPKVRKVKNDTFSLKSFGYCSARIA